MVRGSARAFHSGFSFSHLPGWRRFLEFPGGRDAQYPARRRNRSLLCLRREDGPSYGQYTNCFGQDTASPSPLGSAEVTTTSLRSLEAGAPTAESCSPSGLSRGFDTTCHHEALYSSIEQNRVEALDSIIGRLQCQRKNSSRRISSTDHSRHRKTLRPASAKVPIRRQRCASEAAP